MVKSSQIEVEKGRCRISLDLELPCELKSVGSAVIEAKPTEHYDLRTEGEAFVEIKVFLTWPSQESEAE